MDHSSDREVFYSDTVERINRKLSNGNSKDQRSKIKDQTWKKTLSSSKRPWNATWRSKIIDKILFNITAMRQRWRFKIIDWRSKIKDQTCANSPLYFFTICPRPRRKNQSWIECRSKRCSSTVTVFWNKFAELGRFEDLIDIRICSFIPHTSSPATIFHSGCPSHQPVHACPSAQSGPHSLCRPFESARRCAAWTRGPVNDFILHL